MKGSTHSLKGYGYRWLVWGVMCLAYVIVFFHRIAPGVVADNLMAEFGVTGAALGNLGAVYFYVYMLMQLPAGILADTLGARMTASTGTLIAGAGSVLFGLATGMTMAYAGRFLVGLGVSVVFVAILKVQSQWFKESEFATISGLTSFIGNGGGLLAGIPLALAVIHFGWRTVFLGIGAISVFIAILNYVFVRNSPGDMGLSELIKAGDAGVENPANGLKIMESIKIVISNRFIWPGFVTFAGLSGSILSFSGMWGVPYMMAVYGFDKTTASSYIMVVSAGIMTGALASGIISDRVGKRREPLIVLCVANLAVWSALVFWNGGRPPVGALYPLCFVLGFSSTGYVITWALAKELNPPYIAGIALGIFNIGGFLGPSLLQPLMGYVLDLNWTGQIVEGVRSYPQAAYAKALSLCALAVLISLGCALFVKETNCKNIYREINR